MFPTQVTVSYWETENMESLQFSALQWREEGEEGLLLVLGVVLNLNNKMLQSIICYPNRLGTFNQY